MRLLETEDSSKMYLIWVSPDAVLATKIATQVILFKRIFEDSGRKLGK